MEKNSRDNKLRPFNNTTQKNMRQALRKHGTPAEAMMWKMLKGRQMDGAKFRRQFSIGPYILDFYCPEYQICVELDGDSHYSADGYEHDQKRNTYLYEEHGITTLRYENKDVFKFPEAICKTTPTFPRCRRTSSKRLRTSLIPFSKSFIDSSKEISLSSKAETIFSSSFNDFSKSKEFSAISFSFRIKSHHNFNCFTTFRAFLIS